LAGRSLALAVVTAIAHGGVADQDNRGQRRIGRFGQHHLGARRIGVDGGGQQLGAGRHGGHDCQQCRQQAEEDGQEAHGMDPVTLAESKFYASAPHPRAAGFQRINKMSDQPGALL
jgi:hypothetical protein